MADSFYKLHTPISAVALGFLTSTLFEFIPVGAVVHIEKEYQESGLVELCWADRCYMTYLDTVKMNAVAVSGELTSHVSEQAPPPNSERLTYKAPVFAGYRPLAMPSLKLSLALARF